MTTNEIQSIGFQKDYSNSYNHYINGLVKVQIDENRVIDVFVNDVKINGIHKLEELMYICKKLNISA
ncbi:hypothetical protein GCM10027051_34780 [Niabella terrae]